MDYLYRELAPIGDAAWAQIEEEAKRTLARYLGARRVVDVHGPEGFGLAAVGTGHRRPATAVAEGVECTRRASARTAPSARRAGSPRAAIDD
ncbi:MAG TPA: family 1 encapsulin nanocompartment shell protein, partial [Amaricoccus sp.]|nr:family 1 encapsulin nanocompartment shell protein [Amaricoccus sp.]